MRKDQQRKFDPDNAQAIVLLLSDCSLSLLFYYDTNNATVQGKKRFISDLNSSFPLITSRSTLESKMSSSKSQQETLVKCPTNLSESWYNGPEEINNNWVVLDKDSTLRKEENRDSGHESETDPLIPKEIKKGVKAKEKKRYPKAKASLATATNLKHMAAGWVQKAVGSIYGNRGGYGKGFERL